MPRTVHVLFLKHNQWIQDNSSSNAGTQHGYVFLAFTKFYFQCTFSLESAQVKPFLRHFQYLQNLMRYHLLLQTLESFCRICILTEKNVKLFSLTFFAITHPFDGLVGNPDSSQFQMCDESIPGLCSNTLKKRLLLKT